MDEESTGTDHLSQERLTKALLSGGFWRAQLLREAAASVALDGQTFSVDEDYAAGSSDETWHAQPETD